MAELQLSPSLSPELLLLMSVKQTVSVSATIALSFQKVLDQIFFPQNCWGFYLFQFAVKCRVWETLEHTVLLSSHGLLLSYLSVPLPRR